MGWIETPDGMALPQSVCFVHEKEVLAIIGAKDYYKKEAEDGRQRKNCDSKNMDPDKKVDSACADEDAFEYKDYDGEHVRLVKHIKSSQADTHIEVFVEGKSFWKGIPSFSSD